MVLTVEKLKESIRLVAEMTPVMAPPPRIVFTTSASKDSEERLFPASKYRSKRIRKKLIKRFGGEYRKQPCMWRVDNTIYAHPYYEAAFWSKLK